jgi:mono/diheme cytochrome c family protein
MLGVALLIAGLSTANEIGLAVVAAAFIVFALVSALVLPARYPGFPGRHVGWYVALGILFFVAMISAVLVFGKEQPVAAGETTTTSAAGSTSTSAQTTPTSSTTSSTPATGGKGDPAAGKTVFASAGCGGCHTLKAAGATGNVGPNLDDLKPPYDTVVHQVEVGGGAMPSFKEALSPKQIQDVAAFVVASTQ